VKRLSATLLIGLIFLCITWELWLAPLRPGGSWLVLKVVPLLFPLRGVLHGRRYTYQWSCLLMCLYLCEGLTRSYTDPAPSNALAMIEVLLATAFLVSAMRYLRTTR